jgi:hypothetical protein
MHMETIFVGDRQPQVATHSIRSSEISIQDAFGLHTSLNGGTQQQCSLHVPPETQACPVAL